MAECQTLLGLGFVGPEGSFGSHNITKPAPRFAPPVAFVRRGRADALHRFQAGHARSSHLLDHVEHRMYPSGGGWDTGRKVIIHSVISEHMCSPWFRGGLSLPESYLSDMPRVLEHPGQSEFGLFELLLERSLHIFQTPTQALAKLVQLRC